MELTCPICLLELQPEAKKTDCENCHNTLHMNCMAICEYKAVGLSYYIFTQLLNDSVLWFYSGYQLVRKQGEVLSCPLCRAVWPDSNKLR